MEEKLRYMLLETVEENTREMSKRVEIPLARAPSNSSSLRAPSHPLLIKIKEKKKGSKRKSFKCFPLKSRNFQGIHAFYYKHGSSTF